MLPIKHRLTKPYSVNCINDQCGLHSNTYPAGQYRLRLRLHSHHHHTPATQGLYSLSGKTSYRPSLEATRLDVAIVVSLWNLTGTAAAALLPRCLLNFKAIGKVQTRISRLRDFTRSCGKTSYRLVNRGPGASLCNMGYPSETRLELKSRAYSICFRWPIVFKFCTKHGSITAMLTKWFFL